jgi:hypothetical protein
MAQYARRLEFFQGLAMRLTTFVGFVLASCLAVPAAMAQPAPLKSPADFASIGDEAARSRALFEEAGKVIQSSRCQNCHPVGQRPTQGDDMHPHLPLVVRGLDDQGAIAMRCITCHQTANFQPAGVPGAPKWHIAPVAMAWQGKSLGAICEQIKDPARNGKRSLAQIHDHMAHDELVGWGWHPGGTRMSAPGTQAQFGELIDAWIKTGAACPAP